jgi:hypothetical protein
VKNWILAHRGEWNEKVAANSATSLENAILHGYGIETDIRDLKTALVISHDPCADQEYDQFERFLSKDSRIAINIKSDGLLPRIEPLRTLISDSKSFIFDCSFPELLKYRSAGIPHAIRLSEYEKELYWEPNYIWLDAFESDWWLDDRPTLNLIEKIPTVVVSPELHRREFAKVWNKVLALRSDGLDISVCTDFPNQLASEAGIK